MVIGAPADTGRPRRLRVVAEAKPSQTAGVAGVCDRNAGLGEGRQNAGAEDANGKDNSGQGRPNGMQCFHEQVMPFGLSLWVMVEQGLRESRGGCC
jgi:hypothetical protein